MSFSKIIISSAFAFIVILSISTGSTGCKSTSTTVQTTDSSMSSPVNDTTPVTKGEQIRLMVSLLSAGEGPDRQAYEQLNKLVNEFSKEVNKPIQYVAVAWGREGEADYCFRLTNLDTKQQKSFAEMIKKVFDGRALIFVSENVPCTHIR